MRMAKYYGHGQVEVTTKFVASTELDELVQPKDRCDSSMLSTRYECQIV